MQRWVEFRGNGGGDPVTPYTYQAPANLGDGWTISDADDQGLSVQRLQDMMDAIGRGEYPIIDSIAIASRGNLVFEETIRTQLDEKDGWAGNTDLSSTRATSVASMCRI